MQLWGSRERAGNGLAQVSKEVKSGQYRLLSYFLAKTAVSVPFESAIAIVFTVIIYNMIGFQVCARDKHAALFHCEHHRPGATTTHVLCMVPLHIAALPVACGHRSRCAFHHG